MMKTVNFGEVCRAVGFANEVVFHQWPGMQLISNISGLTAIAVLNASLEIWLLSAVRHGRFKAFRLGRV